MFAYIWEYLIDDDHQDDFLRYYRPEGVWVEFFKNGKGYIRTELLQDRENPQRFITIDYWQSQAERDAFREKHAREFEKIDETCATFTQTERFVGDFNLA